MKGEIIDKKEDWIGVKVSDNDGIEHKVAMQYDGSDKGHSQEGYPDDPSKRTSYEDEMVHQASMYGKWYIYRELGHDTLDPFRNPDRIAATFLTVYGIDLEELDATLGTFYRQVRSHFDSSIDRPVALEPDADSSQIIYKQNLYLDVDLDDVRGIGDDYADDIGAIARQTSAQVGSIDGFAELLGDMLGGAAASDCAEKPNADAPDEASSLPELEVPRFEIEGVSDLYYLYYRSNAGPRTVEREDHFDREPDTRIELPAMAPISTLFQFKLLLLRHLACQLRDVYVEMGVEPPEPFRLLGPGIHNTTIRYKHRDIYPDYFDPLADISGYSA